MSRKTKKMSASEFEQSLAQNQLAKWSRWLEIIIPAYVFGKSWGIAEPKNLALFKAQFPPFLIEATEFLKNIYHFQSVYVQRFVATTCGALLGGVVVGLLSILFHYILNDRKYLDSLRFTAVTIIPVAILNGILSHGLQTLVDNLQTQSVDSLKMALVISPLAYLIFIGLLYLASLWTMGRRTGVRTSRRIWLMIAGLTLLGGYLAAGLMITPDEWVKLIPILTRS